MLMYVTSGVMIPLRGVHMGEQRGNQLTEVFY